MGADGRRVYTWAGRAYPSITSILAGGVPKPFLAPWAAKAAAEYAVAHLDRLRLLPPGQAVREVKQAPFTARDAAAGLGDLVHAAVAADATGQPRPPVPPDAAPFLAAFDQFCADHRPGWLASEQTVYSRHYGYAGTLDAICVLGDTVTLLD